MSGLLFVIDQLGTEVATLRAENERLRAALAEQQPDA